MSHDVRLIPSKRAFFLARVDLLSTNSLDMDICGPFLDSMTLHLPEAMGLWGYGAMGLRAKGYVLKGLGAEG